VAGAGLADHPHPEGVQEEVGTHNLLFRRSAAPTEKDKAQRLTDAAESLQALPDVVWYNSTIGSTNAAPLHVRPGTLAVAWSIPRHNVATHMRLIPVLLRWTRWDRDEPWQQLRAALAAEASGHVRVPAHPRHVRIAQTIDFVGMQSMALNQSPGDIASLCQTVLRLHTAGKVDTQWDPTTGDVVDVSVHVNG
jgi:hypothetical protein